MKKNLLLFVCTLSSLIASGQQYIDLVKFSYTATSQNTFDTGNATTGLSELNGDFTFPLVINDKATILTGVAYNL